MSRPRVQGSTASATAPRSLVQRLFGRRPAERVAAQVSRQFTRLRAEPLKRSELHRSLQQALDAKRGMRRSLVHLAFFEAELGRLGDDALAVLPIGVMGKAFKQLGILIGVSASSRGLNHLSTRMRQVLERRTGSLPERADSTESMETDVGVTESSLDEYDQAVRDSDLAALQGN